MRFSSAALTGIGKDDLLTCIHSQASYARVHLPVIHPDIGKETARIQCWWQADIRLNYPLPCQRIRNPLILAPRACKLSYTEQTWSPPSGADSRPQPSVHIIRDRYPKKEGHGFLRSISEHGSISLLSAQHRVNRTAKTRP